MFMLLIMFHMLVHLYKKEKMIYGFIYFFKFYKEILIKNNYEILFIIYFA